MPVGDLVVLGLQWGDEGKGKIVDEAADRAAAVVRYQGGANAGHTVVVAGRPFALHQLPVGALHPGVACVIGAGCAVDPVALRAEVAQLEAAGIPVAERLVVSGRAQVVLPWMRDIDGAEEALRSQPVGTTRRGIGPTYAAKAGRWGLTVSMLTDPAARAPALASIQPWTVRWLSALGLPAPAADGWAEVADWLAPLVGDDISAIAAARARGRVLFEGQLGLMRDPDRGMYPFTTGASILPPAALVGRNTPVLGVVKPYVTLVGGGHLPTEADAAEAEVLRLEGGEFGATTGRPRRCGWLDLPAARYAVRATGATALAVTKCDLAVRRGELPVCVGYEGWDPAQDYPPAHRLVDVRPRYERWTVGGDPVALARRIAAAVGLPLAYVGTGPERGEGTWLEGDPTS